MCYGVRFDATTAWVQAARYDSLQVHLPTERTFRRWYLKFKQLRKDDLAKHTSKPSVRDLSGRIKARRETNMKRAAVRQYKREIEGHWRLREADLFVTMGSQAAARDLHRILCMDVGQHTVGRLQKARLSYGIPPPGLADTEHLRKRVFDQLEGRYLTSVYKTCKEEGEREFIFDDAPSVVTRQGLCSIPGATVETSVDPQPGSTDVTLHLAIWSDGVKCGQDEWVEGKMRLIDLSGELFPDRCSKELPWFDIKGMRTSEFGDSIFSVWRSLSLNAIRDYVAVVRLADKSFNVRFDLIFVLGDNEILNLETGVQGGSTACRCIFCIGDPAEWVTHPFSSAVRDHTELAEKAHAMEQRLKKAQAEYKEKHGREMPPTRVTKELRALKKEFFNIRGAPLLSSSTFPAERIVYCMSCLHNVWHLLSDVVELTEHVLLRTGGLLDTKKKAMDQLNANINDIVYHPLGGAGWNCDTYRIIFSQFKSVFAGVVEKKYLVLHQLAARVSGMYYSSNDVSLQMRASFRAESFLLFLLCEELYQRERGPDEAVPSEAEDSDAAGSDADADAVTRPQYFKRPYLTASLYWHHTVAHVAPFLARYRMPLSFLSEAGFEGVLKFVKEFVRRSSCHKKGEVVASRVFVEHKKDLKERLHTEREKFNRQKLGADLLPTNFIICPCATDGALSACMEHAWTEFASHMDFDLTAMCKRSTVEGDVWYFLTPATSHSLFMAVCLCGAHGKEAQDAALATVFDDLVFIGDPSYTPPPPPEPASAPLTQPQLRSGLTDCADIFRRYQDLKARVKDIRRDLTIALGRAPTEQDVASRGPSAVSAFAAFQTEQDTINSGARARAAAEAVEMWCHDFERLNGVQPTRADWRNGVGEALVLSVMRLLEPWDERMASFEQPALIRIAMRGDGDSAPA
jgi:hypothetical protein